MQTSIITIGAGIAGLSAGCYGQMNGYRTQIFEMHTTIFDMLNGKYINPRIQDYYDDLPLFPPLIYIGLCVAHSFAEMPQTVTGIEFPLDEPITIDGQERKRLGVQTYNFDPSLAPAGKSVVKIMFTSDYEYWRRSRPNPERHKAEKEQIADQVVAPLDRRFPGLAAQVEMRDVATPMTFERYTSNRTTWTIDHSFCTNGVLTNSCMLLNSMVRRLRPGTTVLPPRSS